MRESSVMQLCKEHLDVDACVDCGLCEKVCPVLNQSDACDPLGVYAAKKPNEQIRRESSSGGDIITDFAHVIYSVSFRRPRL